MLKKNKIILASTLGFVGTGTAIAAPLALTLTNNKTTTNSINKTEELINLAKSLFQSEQSDNLLINKDKKIAIEYNGYKASGTIRDASISYLLQKSILQTMENNKELLHDPKLNKILETTREVLTHSISEEELDGDGVTRIGGNSLFASGQLLSLIQGISQKLGFVDKNIDKKEANFKQDIYKKVELGTNVRSTNLFDSILGNNKSFIGEPNKPMEGILPSDFVSGLSGGRPIGFTKFFLSLSAAYKSANFKIDSTNNEGNKLYKIKDSYSIDLSPISNIDEVISKVTTLLNERFPSEEGKKLTQLFIGKINDIKKSGEYIKGSIDETTNKPSSSYSSNTSFINWLYTSLKNDKLNENVRNNAVTSLATGSKNIFHNEVKILDVNLANVFIFISNFASQTPEGDDVSFKPQFDSLVSNFINVQMNLAYTSFNEINISKISDGWNKIISQSSATAGDTDFANAKRSKIVLGPLVNNKIDLFAVKEESEIKKLNDYIKSMNDDINNLKQNVFIENGKKIHPNIILDRVFDHGSEINQHWGKINSNQFIDPIGKFRTLRFTDYSAWALEKTTDGNLEHLKPHTFSPRFDKDPNGIYTSAHLGTQKGAGDVIQSGTIETYGDGSERNVWNSNWAGNLSDTWNIDDNQWTSLVNYIPIQKRTYIDPYHENRVILDIDYIAYVEGRYIYTTKEFALDNTLIKGYNKDYTVKNKYEVLGGIEKATAKESFILSIKKLIKMIEDINFNDKSKTNNVKDYIGTPDPSSNVVVSAKAGKAVTVQKNISSHFLSMLEWLSSNSEKLTDELLDKEFEKINKIGSINWKSITTIYNGLTGLNTKIDDGAKKIAGKNEYNTDRDVTGWAGRNSLFGNWMTVTGRKDEHNNLLYGQSSYKGIKDIENMFNFLNYWALNIPGSSSMLAQDGDPNDDEDTNIARIYGNYEEPNKETTSALSPNSGLTTKSELGLSKRFVVHNEKDINNFINNRPYFGAKWWENVVISSDSEIDLTKAKYPNIDLSKIVFWNMDMDNVKIDSSQTDFHLAIFDNVNNLDSFILKSSSNKNAFKSSMFMNLEGQQTIDFSSFDINNAKFINLDAQNMNFGPYTKYDQTNAHLIFEKVKNLDPKYVDQPNGQALDGIVRILS